MQIYLDTKRVCRYAKPLSGLILMFVLWVACSGFAVAQAFKSGEELATAVYDRPDGDNFVSLGSMVLVEKGHEPRVRQMFTFGYEDEKHDKFFMIRFKKPADIMDTALLTIDYNDDRDTDQWVYLPAVNKSRRISSKRKGGRFVGSDILYEDLRDRKVHKDKHKILRKEKLNGQDTLVLESIPVSADNSVYDKKISWIHPKILLALRVDIYQNGAEKPAKVVLAKKVKKIQGIWTIMTSVVRDLVTQHETHMKTHKIIYNQDIPKEMFSLKFLEDPQREQAIIKKVFGN